MTFKEIVTKMVKEDSEEWVQNLIVESELVLSTSACEVQFHDLAKDYGKQYICKIDILNCFNMKVASVEVWGRVSDRIIRTQITRNEKAIWFARKTLRDEHGIKRFDI